MKALVAWCARYHPPSHRRAHTHSRARPIHPRTQRRAHRHGSTYYYSVIIPPSITPLSQSSSLILLFAPLLFSGDREALLKTVALPFLLSSRPLSYLTTLLFLRSNSHECGARLTPTVHPTHVAEHSSSKHSNGHTRIVINSSNIRKISDVLLESIGFVGRNGNRIVLLDALV
ncbi:hypothetical protein F4604DRAFT_519564 [Suillus subluteus]|nr:hypothetical protein F4604DRAFT_519564 [Suillus subluteus]